MLCLLLAPPLPDFRSPPVFGKAIVVARQSVHQPAQPFLGGVGGRGRGRGGGGGGAWWRQEFHR